MWNGVVMTGLTDKALCEQELLHQYVREQVGNAWNLPGTTTVWLEQHV